MIFKWFNVINIPEFEAEDLPSRNFDVILESIGQKSIMLTNGIAAGVLVDGVFLSVGLVGRNPFIFEGLAVYRDDNNDLWLGVEVVD